MNIRKAFLLVVISALFFAVNFVSGQSVVRSEKLDKALSDFKTFYEKELKDAGIVGSTFVFLKDNKVAAQYLYGSANLEKNQPVDENTIYHWASNTKPFTGIAIMQLRDRGL